MLLENNKDHTVTYLYEGQNGTTRTCKFVRNEHDQIVINWCWSCFYVWSYLMDDNMKWVYETQFGTAYEVYKYDVETYSSISLQYVNNYLSFRQDKQTHV